MGLFSQREGGSPNNQRYIWLDPNDYTDSIVRDASNGSAISSNPSTWNVSVIKDLKEWRGINLSITVKNVSQIDQSAPFVRIVSGMYHPNWNAAGADSSFRHSINYMNHDSYGMRSELVSYPTVKNPSTDKIGNPNAVYGVNWFAPCLTIDNYKAGIPAWGTQMMSISTNYEYPCRIYGDFDPVSLKAYFRIEGNVNIEGKGIVDKIKPGETRTWSVWLRYEDYNTNIGYYGSNSYRKIAALRSYEPYFVWYWNNYEDPSFGSRIGGRIYGIDLAGPSAPKAYFAPKDNVRRYFLFSSQNKKSLKGKLPLPGQQYVNPGLVSGWSELLNSIVDVDLLKTYGYQAVLLLNISGWGNADSGKNPAFFKNLPINLRNSLSELKQWEKDNSLRVIFSADNTLNKVNLGDFSKSAEPFDQTNLLHSQFENDNFFQGGLRSASGLVLFDLPDIISNSLLQEYVRNWRFNYPSVSMASGSRVDNKLYSYIVPGYLDRSEFLTADYSKGGRDWFLDMLLSGIDPWVYMPISQWYADYGNSVSTENAYDDYVQKIEKDHQAVAVTIDRIVQKPCLLPKKLSWKEQFISYSTISAIDGPVSICQVGDPFLGGRKVCNTQDIHNTYSLSVPSGINFNILVYYKFPGLYNWNDLHSWVPFMGDDSDRIANSGNSLLWLYQQDKLDKAKETILNNVTGINNNNQPPLIPSSFNGDLWLNFDPVAYNDTTDVDVFSVGVGSGLEMYSSFQKTNLIPSTSGSGLASRTLRNWWIWVLDQVDSGWSSGKTIEQQDVYLQTKWCERWTFWMKEIISLLRQIVPDIKKIGLCGSVPNRGLWSIDGLNFGTTDPDIVDSSRELENTYWNGWVNLLDYLGHTMYLSNAVVNYDVPYIYNSSQRRAADPIQTRMYHLLSIRNNLDIARRADKPLIPFISNQYTEAVGYINPNVSSFLYKSLYTSGVNGSIWWNFVYDHSSAISVLGDIQQNWYPVTEYINYKNSSFLLDVDSPDPIQNGIRSIVDFDSEGYIAKFGSVKVVSLGGKKRMDSIEGFGVQRYKNAVSGSVGDLFPEDYSDYAIFAIANSIDGTFELSKAIGKYNKIEVDIIDPSLKNVGIPHWAIEDTFEWINSGSPSHLGQVNQANVISGGIAGARISPGLQELTAPVFQSKYIIPCNTDWYNKENSTIDYDVFLDNGNRDLSIPYANCIIYVPELSQVMVGGYGGVLTINADSKEINRLTIKSDRQLLIKDIKKYQNTIYILDESKLYFFDITNQKFTIDTAVGLPNKLHSMISIFGSNLVIGTEDGIYARKMASSSWKKVISTTGAVNIMSSPDAALAVSDTGESYYSTDGFSWTRVGIVNDKVVNKIQKHRSQILFGTTNGLFQDGGSFYTSNLSLQLLDIFNDAEKSSQVAVNDIDSDFNKAVIGLSDGRYFVYTDDFVLQTESKLSSIHKVLILGNDIWLFGHNQFRIVSEDFIRRLATGLLIR